MFHLQRGDAEDSNTLRYKIHVQLNLKVVTLTCLLPGDVSPVKVSGLEEYCSMYRYYNDRHSNIRH